jgi:hypothetical protein
VTRVASGTCKAVALEDSEDVLGVALEDQMEHTYDGFYETYEPVPVALSGSVIALVATIADTSLTAGDFLEIIDLTSGTMAAGIGVLGEAGSNAGETKTTTSVAKMLEDVTLGSATYAQPASNVSVGDTTITMSSGAPTTMGLNVGDFIILRDVDGQAQVNRVTSLTATVIGLEIPATVAPTAASDYIHAVRQAEVMIL